MGLEDQPARRTLLVRPITPDERGRFDETLETSHWLGAGLADIGYCLPGSVTERQLRCGKPGCACKADPPALHGPYRQWSRALGRRSSRGR